MSSITVFLRDNGKVLGLAVVMILVGFLLGNFWTPLSGYGKKADLADSLVVKQETLEKRIATDSLQIVDLKNKVSDLNGKVANLENPEWLKKLDAYTDSAITTNAKGVK